MNSLMEVMAGERGLKMYGTSLRYFASKSKNRSYVMGNVYESVLVGWRNVGLNAQEQSMQMIPGDNFDHYYILRKYAQFNVFEVYHIKNKGLKRGIVEV